MYDIRWDEGAKDDMRRAGLRAYEVRQIVDAVDEQLAHEPARQSKRKKIIRPDQRLPFEHLEPVWQLRVGDFRIFYDVVDVDESRQEGEEKVYQGVVSVRAVRRKPGHKTTEEIL
ncbi:MAG: type II toxin-antitoxin system RelE/ParE family toxin [Pirellulales bacterium]|nr:type II toxin-antitoxin system RelE/ParE family toxin [Pirellulales bacterium]